MTTRVLLLRHAETAAPDRFHGAESDIDLGENGRNQAEAAAQKLVEAKPTKLYTSPMRRAQQTAEPIGRACGLEPIVVAKLHERKMGRMSGMTLSEGRPTYFETMDRWKEGDLEATHEGGESYRQMQDRVVPEFVRLAEENPGQTIIVVAHGVVIRVLLTSLLEGKSPADFESFAIDFVAVNDLRYDGKTWKAAGLNSNRVITFFN